VNVFDGFSDQLQEGMGILVEAKYIKQAGKRIEARDAIVVDGGGRTMTPGLIDMHQHVMLNQPEGAASDQTRWDAAAGGAIGQTRCHSDSAGRNVPPVKRMKQMQDEGKEIVRSFRCHMSIDSFGSYDSMPAFFTHEHC
jgi:dihydroorotase-like cyclic amidohydrolase